LIVLKNSMNLFALPLSKVVSVAFLLFFVSCTWESLDSTEDSSGSSGRLLIVATSAMIADTVRSIVGDEADVVQLISHGVDPHLYRPGRDDIVKMLEADLVIYNGLHLEGKMQEAFAGGKVSRKAAAMSSFIPEGAVLKDETSGFDPHIWMDVHLWKKMVMPLAKHISTLDPSRKDTFYHNARVLEKELLDLHQYGTELITSIPEEKRALVTSHDAFQYFGKAYGMKVYGVQGLSTDSEAGVKRIDEIVSVIIDKNIPVVFFESGVSPRVLQSIMEAVIFRGGTIRNGGVLYTDSPGPKGTSAGTYTGMMKHNFETIQVALRDG
jgi:manganese/zinc/iron transport system substrate-binding protein